MTVVFDLQRVSLRLGRGLQAAQALSDVDLTIRSGERLGLVGSNGSGKTSLLRLLAGLQAPGAGQLHRPNAARVAMLFQRPHLLNMSVGRNVALGPWLHGLGWALARQRAEATLQQLGMEPLAARNARQLSGGQQQRVALARAWAMAPDVLLLDEPCAHLDPNAQREMETWIQTLTRTSPGVTLVFSSHHLGQVQRLANRVVVLEQGRVLADLPASAFFDGTTLRQRYPAAQAFIQGTHGLIP